MRTRNRTLYNHITPSGTTLALSLLLFGLGPKPAWAHTVVWSEGFENYNTDAGQSYGGLDKNKSGSPNAAPNGSGNPWFGPNPNNAWVTKAMTNPDPIQQTVTPHGGEFMMRGSRDATGWYNGWDNDIDHVNLAYRFNQGVAFTNNFMIDWWFYDLLGNMYPGDPDKGPGCFGDHAALEYKADAPNNTDYDDVDVVTPGPGAVWARMAIGAFEGASGYNTSVYQVQVMGAADGQFGGGEWGYGWFNSSVTRTPGWHHAAISVGGNNLAVLSIDDMVVLTHDTGSANGFNVFTTTELQATPDTYNQSAYYDDVTLSLITGPRIVNSSVSGTNLVINGTDGLVGWTYHVLMSTDATQALSEWTPIATNLLSATGPFTMIATNAVSAAAPKRFFALRGTIMP